MKKSLNVPDCRFERRTVCKGDAQSALTTKVTSASARAYLSPKKKSSRKMTFAYKREHVNESINNDILTRPNIQLQSCKSNESIYLQSCI